MGVQFLINTVNVDNLLNLAFDSPLLIFCLQSTERVNNRVLALHHIVIIVIACLLNCSRTEHMT